MLAQLATAGAVVVVVALGAVVVFELRASLPSRQASLPAPSLCAPRSGGTAGQPAQLKGIRSSGSRLEIELEPTSADAPLRFPAYELVPQSSAHFATGPGQEPRILSGSSGLRVVFPDAGGGREPRWVSISSVIEGQGPGLISEIALLHDPGGGLAVGVGLASPACFTVRELPNPPTLVLNLIAESPAR